ncbi:MAG: hypothetical protein NTW21_13130 [Verrucomicrobia bacterium]|nr:hypothetical protein [Verrucomicrobiota bacterium]
MKHRAYLSTAACAVTFYLSFTPPATAADVTATWTAAVRANWADGTKWTCVPGPNVAPDNNGGAITYDAVIAAAGTPYTVAVASDILIEHLTLNSAAATVEVQSNSLRAQTGIALANGVLLLNGGSLNGTTITPTGGSFVCTSNGSNILHGTTLTGDLRLNQAGGGHVVRLQNGATFTGNAFLGTPDGTPAGFGYEQTGTINAKTLNLDAFYGGAFLSIDGDHTMTFGPTLVARGTGNIGQAHFIGGFSTLINQGRISSDLAGQTLTINPSVFTNEGITEVLTGASLNLIAGSWSNAVGGTLRATGAGSAMNLNGNFSNAGTIVLTDGTLNLYGNCTTAGLGLAGFSRSGACVVNLSGDLNNAGSTFALTATTGDWTLEGGRIIGGTITEAGGAKLRFTANGSNRLDKATFTGDLLLNEPGASHIVRLLNDATFTGNAYLGTADGSASGFGYEQNGTLNAKTLNFDTFFGGAFLSIDGDHTLTFGPTLVARGTGNIGQAHFLGGTSTLVNEGRISSDLWGQMLAIGPSAFTNEGIVEVLTGASLNLTAATWSNAAGGTFRVTGADSVMNLYGSFSNAGAIVLADATLNLLGNCTTTGLGLAGFSRSGTCAVNLIGDLDNTASTFALTATTGDWTLEGGRIIGGTITEAGGAKLRFTANGGNRLDKATFTGDLLLNEPGASHIVRLLNDATFTGNAYLGTPDGNSSGFGYEQDGTLDAKTLNFTADGAFLSIDGDHTLTFGPGLVARGAGSLGQARFLGGFSRLVNQGRIAADLAGLALTINPSAFTNVGITEVLAGATLNLTAATWSNAAGGTFRATGPGSILNLYGDFSNAGAIVLADATLNLHGNCTTAGLGLAGFSRSGACAVNLIGDLDNTASTFALTATTGDWTLDGGRIIGGTIVRAGAGSLLFSNNGSNRLDGATFTGDLLLNQPGGGHVVRLQNGAAFTGNAFLGNADGNQGGIGYEQTGTLDNKKLNFTDGNSFLSIDGTNTLTFGPSLVARGAGSLGQARFLGGISTLVNEGRISANLAGQTLSINPSVFTNEGIAEALTGATLSITAGYIQTTGSTRVAGGTITTSNALIQIDGGSLGGHGAINSDVQSAGTIAPDLADPAGLAINGNLTLGGTSVMSFDLGGTAKGVSYAALTHTGVTPVTLAGALAVQFANGFETRAFGTDSFVVVTSSQNLQGTFANVLPGARLATSDGHGSFRVNYGPSSPFGPNTVVLNDFAKSGVGQFAIWLITMGVPPGQAGAADDPDHDGLANAIEYALGLHSMLVQAGRELSAPSVTQSAAASPALEFHFRMVDSQPGDLNMEVEASPDLSGPWQRIAWKSGANPWSGAVAVLGAPVAGQIPVTLTDIQPIAAAPTRFLRLRVTIVLP